MDRFMFFQNFREMADKLPDEMRLKFYDALMAYAFDGIESDDAIISALITAIKPSLDKVDKRGGNHNPTGQNQYTKDKKINDQLIEVKSGQNYSNSGQNEVKSGQSGQSFLETETETETETEVITPSNPPRGGMWEREFADFWQLYTPISTSDGFVAKGNKQKCKEKYEKILKEGKITHATIMQHLAEYLEYCRKNNVKSCGAEVYLNKRRFENDYSSSQAVGACKGERAGTVRTGDSDLVEACRRFVERRQGSDGSDLYGQRSGLYASQN